MYSEGSSLEQPGDAAVNGDTDWSKGLKWGVSHRENAACEKQKALARDGS